VFMDLKTHHVEVANMYSLVEKSLTESWWLSSALTRIRVVATTLDHMKNSIVSLSYSLLALLLLIASFFIDN
jgi:hypothetical protein